MTDKKNNEEKLNDLKVMKEWISKQLHLPQNIEDILIQRFLHTCNYSLEQSKHLVDLFYTVRSQAPEIFGNRDPTHPSIQKMFENIDMVPLPKLTDEKYKLFIYRLVDTDPDAYNFVDSLRAFFLVSDIRMISEKDFPAGEVPIFDMEGFALRHVTKIVLPVLKKYMIYTQEAHPIKLKQIHIINVSPFLDRCMAIIKPLMKSEVASMLHFHLPNSNTLYEYVPKNLLPAEYGGEVGNMSEMKKEWVSKIIQNREYFLDETKWAVNETKRPIENRKGTQVFGMEGSFRSLSID